MRDVVLDQHHFDLRYLARAQDLVVLEIRIQHVAAIAIHDALLEQRIGDALQDAAIDLADHARGIDGTPAIVRAEDLLDVHAAGLGIDGKFHIVDSAIGDAAPWRIRETRVA